MTVANFLKDKGILMDVEIISSITGKKHFLSELMKEYVEQQSEKVKVELIEYERGWGSKIDSVREFDSLKEAQDFCAEFNSKNDKSVLPDWYMIAKIKV